jgi:hypothetical protein
MKRYFEHMHTKSTHERRQHAVQVATMVTGVVFLGWLGTLGYRFVGPNAQIAAENQNAQQTQLAGVLSGAMAPQGGSSLEVATTSYLGQ